jgi:Protein of unknown function (DUF1592)/Protein of unknown function (DUF1588)/Protein of unknown function (DUF1595)/Protein of unknown function (DUF1585)/Protein of unknown function (DUF1587)
LKGFDRDLVPDLCMMFEPLRRACSRASSRSITTLVATLALAAAGAGLGCTGRVSGGTSIVDDPTGAGAGIGSGIAGGGGSGGSAGGSGGATVSSPLCVSGGPAPAAARIRRLTRYEIQNTLVDLLGTNAGPLAAGLETDSQALGYSTGDQRGVSAAYVGGLKTMAEGLGALVRATVAMPTFAAACFASDAGARTCADKYLRDIGGRAFRRPLEDREATALLTVYDAGVPTGTDGDATDRFRSGLDYAVRSVFQSPHFIFRTELGPISMTTAGATTLTPYELASALSYGTIASPPDAMLTAAATGGQLKTPDQIGAQVRRLITARPDRFKAMVNEFTVEWLGINFAKPAWSKDTKAYPMFTPNMKSAFSQETTAFLSDWVDGGSSLTKLLTSTDGFVNRDNAPVYGLTSTSVTFQKTPLPAGKRAGILTQPGFLGSAAHTDGSSPVYRGLAVMGQLLCNTPPPVPAMVPPLPAVDKTTIKTTRQRYAAHTTAAFCSACHSQFDPMGMTFENYDGLGQWRDQENGVTVDPSGAIVGTMSSDAPMTNAVALAGALAASPEVASCFARQVFRFDVGRMDTAADACSIADATKAYSGKNLDLRELLVALATSPAFAARTASAPGGP